MTVGGGVRFDPLGLSTGGVATVDLHVVQGAAAEVGQHREASGEVVKLGLQTGDEGLRSQSLEELTGRDDLLSDIGS